MKIYVDTSGCVSVFFIMRDIVVGIASLIEQYGHPFDVAYVKKVLASNGGKDKKNMDSDY